MISRRKFLKISALAGGATLLPMPFRWLGRGRALAYQVSPGLTKFRSALPTLGPTGIPVATADTLTYPGSDYYKMVAGEFRQVMHPDFADPAKPAYMGPGFTGSKLWGYADDAVGAPQRYLGGLIVANTGRPVRLRMRNNLPNIHPVAIDPIPDMALPDELGKVNRMSVHLHGGFIPWISDGSPMAWFDPNGNYGISAKDALGTPHSIPGMGLPPAGSFDYYWPNQQSSRLMWYHDHAHSITRNNAYVGLATGYLLVDGVMNRLIAQKVIPDMAHTVPLILQEKSFVPVTGNPEPGGVGQPGDLWYPSVYEGPANGQQLPGTFVPPLDGNTGHWDTQPAMPMFPLPNPSCVPEFFGDTIVINGECYPSLTVEQRHYRFLLLNASQARFFNLQLYYADPSGNEVALVPLVVGGVPVLDPNGLPTMVPSTAPGPPFIQIGNEAGFIPAPVAHSSTPKPILFDPVTGNPTQYNLLVAPAERADFIVDFTNVPAGSKLILYSDAPAPFPGGDPRNDHYLGQPDWTSIAGSAGPASGMGPNTRTLMQFNVTARTVAGGGLSPDPASMNILQKVAQGQLSASYNPLPPIAPLNQALSVKTRYLTLNEDFDMYGRLEQMLGSNVVTAVTGTKPDGSYVADPVSFANAFMSPPTETVKAGTVEIWKIINRTMDTHPIHFHLVNVQLISRQDIDVPSFDAAAAAAGVGTTAVPTAGMLGPPRGPEPNERGWKETVRMNPGEMTTVIMKFDLPRIPFALPKSEFSGGYEYMWHCHILEHEEHDMMRPLVVMP